MHRAPTRGIYRATTFTTKRGTPQKSPPRFVEGQKKEEEKRDVPC